MFFRSPSFAGGGGTTAGVVNCLGVTVTFGEALACFVALPIAMVEKHRNDIVSTKGGTSDFGEM